MNFEQLLKYKNITKKYLKDAYGITSESIYNWVSGKKKISDINLKYLTNELKMQTDELLKYFPL